MSLHFCFCCREFPLAYGYKNSADPPYFLPGLLQPQIPYGEVYAIHVHSNGYLRSSILSLSRSQFGRKIELINFGAPHRCTMQRYEKILYIG